MDPPSVLELIICYEFDSPLVIPSASLPVENVPAILICTRPITGIPGNLQNFSQAFACIFHLRSDYSKECAKSGINSATLGKTPW